METNKGTLRGSIMFYTFVFGVVIAAFVSGYKLGRTVENNEWLHLMRKECVPDRKA